MTTISKKTRADYQFFFPIQTRWADNDVYGHVNNVTFYSYFDTAANALLIQHALFDFKTSPIIGLVVESKCTYFSELSYPEVIDVAVAIEKIGRSSVTYSISIFKKNQSEPAAQGYFVHVFVDRDSRKSIELPNSIREALTTFMTKST